MRRGDRMVGRGMRLIPRSGGAGSCQANRYTRGMRPAAFSPASMNSSSRRTTSTLRRRTSKATVPKTWSSGPGTMRNWRTSRPAGTAAVDILNESDASVLLVVADAITALDPFAHCGADPPKRVHPVTGASQFSGAAGSTDGPACWKYGMGPRSPDRRAESSASAARHRGDRHRPGPAGVEVRNLGRGGDRPPAGVACHRGAHGQRAACPGGRPVGR